MDEESVDKADVINPVIEASCKCDGAWGKWVEGAVRGKVRQEKR